MEIISNTNKEKHPEHTPPVPYNTLKDKEKRHIRKITNDIKRKHGVYDPIIITKDGIEKKASELTISEQEYEIVKCTLNPIYFIETYLTIFDQTQGKSGKIVPFKLFTFQKELINTYLNNKFVIANKYRQAGVSTTTCAYIAWYVMFNNDRNVAIVANKLETARDELMFDVVNFIENCPKWLRPKTGKETRKNYKNTQKLKRYDNNSSISAFSSSGLRGYTPTLIFWDETAWTENSDRFWTSAMPTLQTGGAAILVSTPSGLDPVFYKTFTGAIRGENNFKAIELWWFNDPRYNKDLKWIKNKNKKNEMIIIDENFDNDKRIKLMNDGWEATSPWFEKQIQDANYDMKKIAQELLCSFLGSGDNFIAEEYLKRIEEEEIMTPIRFEYLDKNMWIWEDPIPGESYIMGIDVSPGHGDDYSSINILKIIKKQEEKIVLKNDKEKKIKIITNYTEQVAEYYSKVSPQILSEIVYYYAKKYNNAYCVVDITGGYGIQTVEKLFEFGYENIHYAEISHKPARDRLNGYIKNSYKTMADGSVISVDLIPGFFIGNNRASVLLEMQRTIHLGEIKIRSSRLLNELKTFVTVPGNRIADHKRSFHDDSIMSLAISLYVLNYGMNNTKENKTINEKIINAIITINDINNMKNKFENNNKIIKPTRDFINNPYYVNNWLFNNLDKEKNK